MDNTSTGLVFGSITSMVTGVFKPLFVFFNWILVIEMNEQMTDLMYVFVTGFIGAFGGLIATWVWKKIIKQKE